MKKIILIISLFVANIWANTHLHPQQLIVVTTKGWNTNYGKLQRYELKNNQWHKVGKQIDIKLGRNGLGWGIGLHQTPQNAKYIKYEGDGRSPAGIFALKHAFGYNPFDINYPYKVYTRANHCVDDIHSKYYNKIVDSTKIDIDYHSKEYMKFAKDYYKYGITVNHNHFDEDGAIKGRGSCIFIHIKSIPTAGCTVMSETQIKEILRWLDKTKNPLLIQAPSNEIGHLLHRYIK
jgi:D-alanyl-D-alanine dipeptidase